ncbi:681_t:CDS:2 [Paraglomus brasilianum]|uniref:681_t:CDS:1 n=1 Tax=Paraglomus brasilianum TaxID=144538 RepID=A0A9N9ACX3_9GLOM|nr:681_t:CDS:2 [Paraglomus brasilianum]
MDLPIEILFQIFAHVYPPNVKKERSVIPVLTARKRHDARRDVLSCSLVCKFWNAVANYILWTEPEFYSTNSLIRFIYVLGNTTSRGNIVKLRDGSENAWQSILDYNDKPSPDNRFLVRRLSFRPKVTDTQPYFDCPLTKYINDNHIHVLAERLPFLTSISLRDCTYVTDNSVIHLVAACSEHLRDLDLTNCLHITDATVHVISSVCERLEHLSLRGCGKITDNGASRLRTLSLKAIDLSWCRRVSDASIRHLVTGRRTLQPALRRQEDDGDGEDGNIRDEKRLDGGISGKVNNAVSIRHLANGRTLRQQKGEENEKCLDDVMLSKAGGTSNNDMDNTSKNRRCELVELRVTGCRRVTREGLVRLAEELFIPSRNPDNRVIQLETFEFSCPTTKISGSFKDIIRIFEILPQTLSRLHIYDARYIPHYALPTLAGSCPQLKSLKIIDCPALNDEMLSYLLVSMTELETLSLNKCQHLTDEAVLHITNSKCAYTLINLDFSDCYNLTNAAVESMMAVATTSLMMASSSQTSAEQPLKKFARLSRLYLQNNQRITIHSIIRLVRALPNLEVLDISGCGDGITATFAETNAQGSIFVMPGEWPRENLNENDRFVDENHDINLYLPRRRTWFCCVSGERLDRLRKWMPVGVPIEMDGEQLDGIA